MLRKYRVEFAPFDESAYHADFDNRSAVKHFLEQIEEDAQWKDVPYRVVKL